MKPKDWQEGRYQYDRSFLWNLLHYKRVNYARVVNPGESEHITNVINTRAILFLAFLAVALWSFVGAAGVGQ